MSEIVRFPHFCGTTLHVGTFRVKAASLWPAEGVDLHRVPLPVSPSPDKHANCFLTQVFPPSCSANTQIFNRAGSQKEVLAFLYSGPISTRIAYTLTLPIPSRTCSTTWDTDTRLCPSVNVLSSLSPNKSPSHGTTQRIKKQMDLTREATNRECLTVGSCHSEEQRTHTRMHTHVDTHRYTHSVINL